MATNDNTNPATEGDQSLTGSAAADTLTGGFGSDTLTGGDGTTQTTLYNEDFQGPDPGTGLRAGAIQPLRPIRPLVMFRAALPVLTGPLPLKSPFMWVRMQIRLS